MINFEEELKKFHRSLEVEEAEDSIYNQNLDDMVDVVVDMMREAGRQDAAGTRRSGRR